MKTSRGVMLLLLVFCAGWLGSRRFLPTQQLADGQPEVVRSDGYLGSGACQACHPKEHASFSQTYHRSMTRTARDVWARKDAPELPVELSDGAISYELRKDEGGQIWAKGPNLHLLAQALFSAPRSQTTSERRTTIERVLQRIPRAKQQLVMVTGSHHYLAFWLEGGREKELRQLPFVFLLGSRAWAPREEVFLQPPEGLPHVARWNANCIQCHAVSGKPGQSEEQTEEGLLVRYETTVAELGISCEACHGPGKAHADRFRNPVRRLLARSLEKGSGQTSSRQGDRIVNPRALSADAELALCGQCHSYFVPTDPDSWWETGFVGRFFPGQKIDSSRLLLTPDPDELRQARLSRGIESIFWGEGTIRVGGRETNGLLASPCYQNGEGPKKLRCTNCHSLHAGSKSDQLTQEMQTDPDAGCKSCHQDEKARNHSGHAAGSAGASCINCHMPKTTYALLKRIASHRITSPGHRLTDPPSACVLCHVDRSEEWHHESLERLFPLLPPGAEATSEKEIPTADPELPFAVQRAIQGDAAERAIFAATMSSLETREAAGDAWPRAVLTELTRDPYSAVRRIAERSLADLDQRVSNGAPQAPGVPPQMNFARLHEARDDSPIVISE